MPGAILSVLCTLTYFLQYPCKVATVSILQMGKLRPKKLRAYPRTLNCK